MGRRTERIEQRKEQIADALLALLEQKPLEEINIKEVTDQAGVGRVSYFRYFRSMESALGYKGRLLWRRWKATHPCPQNGSGFRQAIWFFSFFDSEPVRPLLALLYRRLSTEALLGVFLEAGYPVLWHSSLTPQYGATCQAFSTFGVLLEWTRRNFAESPAELAQLCPSAPLRILPLAVEK